MKASDLRNALNRSDRGGKAPLELCDYLVNISHFTFHAGLPRTSERYYKPRNEIWDAGLMTCTISKVNPSEAMLERSEVSAATSTLPVLNPVGISLSLVHWALYLTARPPYWTVVGAPTIQLFRLNVAQCTGLGAV